MLEKLLEEYKEYEPVVNYFHENSYDCSVHSHSVGWHCSLAKKTVNNPYDEEIYANHERVHTVGNKTALEALQTAINMIELNIKKGNT